jgi:putative membrane protein
METRFQVLNECLTGIWVFANIQKMKSILRGIVFYSVALFLTTQMFAGVRVDGGVEVYIAGGIVLSVLFFLLKPILNVVTLPLNIITLGLFSFVTNAIILYLLTVFVSNISITAFKFGGLSAFGFVIPQIQINSFFAFIVASVSVTLIVGFLKWLIKK